MFENIIAKLQKETKKCSRKTNNNLVTISSRPYFIICAVLILPHPPPPGTRPSVDHHGRIVRRALPPDDPLPEQRDRPVVPVRHKPAPGAYSGRVDFSLYIFQAHNIFWFETREFRKMGFLPFSWTFFKKRDYFINENTDFRQNVFSSGVFSGTPRGFSL